MYYEQKTGWNKKTREIILILLICLAAGNAVSWPIYFNASRRDVRVRDVLIVHGQNELSSARDLSQQLSRTGGSHTSVQLAQLRQHLYAIRTLNSISASLYGASRGVVDESRVNQALDTISTCELRLLSGQAIDVQLSELWSLLDGLQADLDKLVS